MLRINNQEYFDSVKKFALSRPAKVTATFFQCLGTLEEWAKDRDVDLHPDFTSYSFVWSWVAKEGEEGHMLNGGFIYHPHAGMDNTFSVRLDPGREEWRIHT